MNKKTVITINEINYEVEFPNNGQLIDIDVTKLQLTNNRYNDLKKAFPERAKSIDMLSVFINLIPKIEQDLNVSIFALQPEQHAILMHVYENQFLPWYNELENNITSAINLDNKKQ